MVKIINSLPEINVLFAVTAKYTEVERLERLQEELTEAALAVSHYIRAIKYASTNDKVEASEKNLALEMGHVFLLGSEWLNITTGNRDAEKRLKLVDHSVAQSIRKLHKLCEGEITT